MTLLIRFTNYKDYKLQQKLKYRQERAIFKEGLKIKVKTKLKKVYF